MPSRRLPSNVTVPERGRSAPAMDLSRVDLPAPVAPATQPISPLATSIEAALFGRHEVAREHIGAAGKPGEFEHLVRLAAGFAHHGVAHKCSNNDVVDDRHGLEALDDLEGAPDATLTTLGRRHGRDIHAV